MELRARCCVGLYIRDVRDVIILFALLTLTQVIHRVSLAPSTEETDMSTNQRMIALLIAACMRDGLSVQESIHAVIGPTKL